MPSCARCGFESDQAVRFCPECGAEQTPGSSAGEQRRIVTVLFCDLTGSTALGESLDPERLRALLARYFERMQGIVEHHGGTVEKFIGDAVMAVFGVPIVHEDDALRAVRAAVEMRDALPELGLQGRIGVMTGEVVTGTAERLVTGDPVNVAARLEATAEPGTILIGQPTLALVRDAVHVEALEPLILKGKAKPVAAHLLLHVLDSPERSHHTPLVGRHQELALLHSAWDRVQAERTCEVVTIVGEAGVGKSRLVAELVARLEARVVRGHCLPYGEGITYWPVVEVLKQLDVLPPDETASSAMRSLLGQSTAETTAEELAWAFRRTLEHAAAEQPLLVVFDDIQWGEQTFHDLIEHVALLSSGVPILLLCMARPELSERHPTWPITLTLAPLSEDDVDELIAERAAGDLRSRIARAAGGNPLFVEEMLAMAAETDADVSVPPTLQALLAARLDQLEASERSVLERGSIEGETFHRGAVQALTSEETPVTPRLAALVRKQLIHPGPALLPGEDGFHFRHVLLRDAAYDGLPKAVRAELHRLFAVWLEQHGQSLVERHEVLGYHLEQACRYDSELGLPADERTAAAARAHLAAAGRRARLRGDDVAAVRLLQRAVALVPPTAVDLEVETELVDVLYWAGRGEEALPCAESAARRASATGDQVAELCTRIQVELIHFYREPEGATERLAAVLEQALPVLDAADDDRALYIACKALGQVANQRGQMDAAFDAYERAVDHARRAGLGHEELGFRSAFLLFGTAPVPAVLAWLDEHEPEETPNHWLRRRRAEVLAMLGRFDESREILASSRSALAERGQRLRLASLLVGWAEIELQATEAAAAHAYAVEAARQFDELGENAALAEASATLARALYALDRLDEADEAATRAARLSATDDAFTQAQCMEVKAKVLARRGEADESERIARGAVAISERTDMIVAQGDAYADLAEVLVLGGDHAAAAVALERALTRYERKGDLVSARRTRAQLDELVRPA